MISVDSWHGISQSKRPEAAFKLVEWFTKSQKVESFSINTSLRNLFITKHF